MTNLTELGETLSGGEIKKRDFRNDLKKDLGWYQKWKIWLGLIWNLGTILIISLGAISSFLVLAAPDNDHFTKYFAASLTSTSALITAALSQFRVRDLWQLRENGRLETMELLDALRLVDVSDPAKAEQALAPLRARRRELTRQQAQSFFSTTNPVAAPTNPK